MAVKFKTLESPNCSLHYPSMANKTREFSPYLTQSNRGPEWLGKLSKVIQLIGRNTSNWPQTTWFPSVFLQHRTWSIRFVFLRSMVVTFWEARWPEFLGYKRQEGNRVVPLELLRKYEDIGWIRPQAYLSRGSVYQFAALYFLIFIFVSRNAEPASLAQKDFQ